MPLALNKKGGIELSTLAEIILILIAAGLIIYVFNYAADRAEEKTSEKLCRGFNAIRVGTKIDKGPVTLNLAPRACKTIDKKNLPGKGYKDYPGGLTEGAKAELRDLIAKCWYMWLEGKQPNIFDTETTSLKNKCFVCYVFSMQDDISIKIPEFKASLDHPYEAADSSKRCAAAGQGGFCMPSCDKSSNFIEVDSSRCQAPLKCCISKDECINKGGSCEPKEGYEIYDKWSCRTGNCYVKEENFMTYLDYVQGTRGATGGAGFIVYENKIEDTGLTNKKKYGITFISPGNSWGWDTTAWGIATLASIPAEILLISKFKIVSLPTGVGVGAVTTPMLYEMTQKSGTLVGYNFIYISEYDAIKNECAIERGVDAR